VVIKIAGRGAARLAGKVSPNATKIWQGLFRRGVFKIRVQGEKPVKDVLEQVRRAVGGD
jgi:hypothetical protein